MVLAAFLPLLVSSPGTVTDDTKTYLYLDPGRYVRQAASLWDPNVALGTVTHQNIGYLLPMGPYYWAMAELHLPLWVAQRLWLGALLFGAGTGVLYLGRAIGLGGPGRHVAALGFMFTPYVLQYSGRISVILMPWAGLPWMVAFVILALRKGGWRYPALFALVVALVSGINASSILFVGIAPTLWLPYSVVVARDSAWRRASAVAGRIGLLTALVSVWWAIGLQVEAAYGINVLKYTETVPATSSASSAAEVIRGLGYWYFYGADRVGAWTQSSLAYTQDLWLLGASFAVPTLCFLAAAFTRWRHRAYFVLLAMVGTVLAVGPNPYTNPSALGSGIKAFMADTTAGLALRSTDRASPVVILSLAMFLGAGVSALASRVHRTGLIVGAFAAAAVIGASAPLWSGGGVASGFVQPAAPPLYVRQAVSGLDATNPSTRVYALPGNNFAAYRWGDTIDPVYAGLMTRPFVTHEQQIMGSLATADLLQAMDSPLQQGTMDWNTLAPMSALISAGNVLVQYNQAYERYDTPNPQQLAVDLARPPPGLTGATSYGAPRPNIPLIPHVDEASLARPSDLGWTAPLVAYSVASPRPVVRTESTRSPLVVDGDASGIVNASSVGLLAGNPTIFYAGTLDTDPSLRRSTLGAPATLVVTDTNRKQGYRWNTIGQNTGYTETAAEPPDSADPTDNPIDLFPGAPQDAQTTTALGGVDSVTASSYGSPISYLPEDRPSAALDGNTQTAWLEGSLGDPRGQWWQVALHQPRTLDRLTLVQPQTGDPDRWITRVTLVFDGGHPETVSLGPASRTAAGQVVRFPSRSVTTLRITVDGVSHADDGTPATSRSAVGLAEVRISGVTVDESVVMPEDLLRAAGTTSISDRLSLIMTRLRSSGTPPRTDTETALARTFWLPTPRTFSLTGQARISPLIPDDQIDRLVGRTGPPSTGIVASSLGRLPGDLKAGAMATIDGDPTTAWEPGFGASHQAGQWLQYRLPRSITTDHLDLEVVADGLHSVPTSITVTTGSGQAVVRLPPIADDTVPGSTVDVPISYPPLTGQSLRITFDTVRLEYTVNYYSQSPIALPLGIAEVGIPGVRAPALPAVIPAPCRNDLISVDGTPVWVSVSGSASNALDGQALQVSLCGPDAGGLVLGPGTHTLRAADGQVSGFNIDQLAFDSAPGGGPMPLAHLPGPGSTAGMLALAPPPASPSPVVHVASQSATTIHLRVSGVTRGPGQAPFDLVLGESINAGWTATIGGGRSLGPPTLIDGFANGWRIDPSTLVGAVHDGAVSVNLVWQPQQRVDVALVLSLVGMVACIILVGVPLGVRRRRRRDSDRQGVGELRAGDPALPGLSDAPTLVMPFRAEAPRSPIWVAVAGGVLTGVIGGVISSVAIGVATGVATAVVLSVPRLRIVLGLVSIAGVLGAGTYEVLHQHAGRIPSGGAWALSFTTASWLAWVGVVFLGADGVVDVVQRHRRGRRSGGGDGSR